MASSTLGVYEETSKSTIETSIIQDLKKAKQTAENELENLRITTRQELKEQKFAQRVLATMLQTRDREIEYQATVITSHEKTLATTQFELTKTKFDLQFSNMTCDLLRAELANEKKEKEKLVSMSRMHQAQNAEVIEGMKRVQERLAKYDNALIAKEDVIAQYKEKSEVLEKKCDDAIWKVVKLMKEAEKRKEDDRLEVVLGKTKENMLEFAGNEMIRLQFKIDEMAWEMEKMKEKREVRYKKSKKLREAHECTIELVENEIERLNGMIQKMACEMETMRGEILSKKKDSSKVEELEQTIQKMRESFDKIGIEEKAQEEVLEPSESEELEDEDEDELELLSCSSSESEWEQVSENEGERASL